MLDHNEGWAGEYSMLHGLRFHLQISLAWTKVRNEKRRGRAKERERERERIEAYNKPDNELLLLVEHIEKNSSPWRVQLCYVRNHPPSFSSFLSLFSFSLNEFRFLWPSPNEKKRSFSSTVFRLRCHPFVDVLKKKQRFMCGIVFSPSPAVVIF